MDILKETLKFKDDPEKQEFFRSMLDTNKPVTVGKTKPEEFKVDNGYWGFRSNSSFIPKHYVVTYIRAGYLFVIWDGEEEEDVIHSQSLTAMNSEPDIKVLPTYLSEYTNFVSSFKYLEDRGIKPKVIFSDGPLKEERGYKGFKLLRVQTMTGISIKQFFRLSRIKVISDDLFLYKGKIYKYKGIKQLIIKEDE